MTTSLLGLLLSLGSIFITPSIVHSNVVGELRIENFNQELFVDAVVDKHMLTGALIREADCAPSDMLSICGGKYIRDHVIMKVNGRPVVFDQQGLEVFQNQIVFRYYLGDIGEAIESIEVESDYMLEHYEHAVLKVKVGVFSEIKSYNITAERRKIQSKLS